MSNLCKNLILSRRLIPNRSMVAAASSKFGAVAQESSDNHLSIGPSVRLLLNLYDISASKIKATGPHDRLLKGDVLQYINANKLEPKPFRESAQSHASTPPKQPSQAKKSSVAAKDVGAKSPTSKPKQTVLAETEDYKDLDLSSMRKTIAKRLTQSKSTIPHIYSGTSCDVTRLLQLRKELANDGIKVSVNDFIVRACATALQRMPEVNSIWDGEDSEPLMTVDIAVAVATENGLITPIVRSADEKGVLEISNKVKELAGKARDGKLQPPEFQGGSFTISNLGMYGIKEFTAVINPPQSCILAVGATQVVLDQNNKPVSVIMLTLSSDSRVVDEQTASKFLSVVRKCLENPDSQFI